MSNHLHVRVINRDVLQFRGYLTLAILKGQTRVSDPMRGKPCYIRKTIVAVDALVGIVGACTPGPMPVMAYIVQIDACKYLYILR